MLKLKNDALRDDALPLVVVGCTSKQSGRQCAATTPPAWIMQPPPTGRHRAERDYFTERGRSLMQNNWKEPAY